MLTVQESKWYHNAHRTRIKVVSQCSPYENQSGVTMLTVQESKWYHSALRTRIKMVSQCSPYKNQSSLKMLTVQESKWSQNAHRTWIKGVSQCSLDENQRGRTSLSTLIQFLFKYLMLTQPYLPSAPCRLNSFPQHEHMDLTLTSSETRSDPFFSLPIFHISAYLISISIVNLTVTKIASFFKTAPPIFNQTWQEVAQ